MGRHKGSKNKVHKNKVHKKCRRGRPKGTSKKAPTESCDMSNVIRLKFLGYCKKCKTGVTSKELISKYVFVCYSCGKKDRIKNLLKEIERERPKNKKEYLDSTIHATHIDSIPLSTGLDISPDNLKIQE